MNAAVQGEGGAKGHTQFEAGSGLLSDFVSVNPLIEKTAFHLHFTHLNKKYPLRELMSFLGKDLRLDGPENNLSSEEG